MGRDSGCNTEQTAITLNIAGFRELTAPQARCATEQAA